MSWKGYRFDSYGKEPTFAKFLPDAKQDVDEHMLDLFYLTMYERQMIWKRRFIDRQQFPWTEDDILLNAKYTHAYRELDRASQYLISQILLDNSLSEEDVLFRTMVYRFYNQPNTFLHHEYPVELPHYDTFDKNHIHNLTRRYREKVDNPWHTAYLMNLAFAPKPEDWDEKRKGKFKDHAYCTIVFDRVHQLIPHLLKVIKSGKSVSEVMKVFEMLPAVSHFQSHEFFIDICYINKYWKKPLNDWNTDSYTNVGPGASLGLRLIFPSLQPNEQINGIYTLRDIAADYMEHNLGLKFPYLQWNGKVYSTSHKKPNITLHQIEMWLCEFSKYWKMMHNVGKQRSKYVPSQKSSQDKSFYLY